MKVTTTKDIRNKIKDYFESAEKERISIKRGNKYVNLTVTDEPDKVFLGEK
ncbi:MAG: hypothetical protein LBL90_01245 [Prevotellaceae bacterium]|jgi:hypothetical protein|nr:hypothetical protein [Prevotellaceae bacterium]